MNFVKLSSSLGMNSLWNVDNKKVSAIVPYRRQAEPTSNLETTKRWLSHCEFYDTKVEKAAWDEKSCGCVIRGFNNIIAAPRNGCNTILSPIGVLRVNNAPENGAQYCHLKIYIFL